MRYVTETELRELAAHGELDQVKLDEQTRLTPGARQFAIDFHIPIISPTQKAKKSSLQEEPGHQSCDCQLDVVAKRAGSMLRLCAKRSDGICNGLAKALDRYGLAWIRQEFVSSEPAEIELAPLMYPPVLQGIHELYFELSVLDSILFELECELKDFSEPSIKRFVCDIAFVRHVMASALESKVEELCHE